MPVIFGSNPVLEALRSRQPIDKIFLLSSKQGSLISKIYHAAKKQNIPVVRADKRKLEKLTGGSLHGGVVALVAPLKYISLEDLISKINLLQENANILILDKIQDPQNFGAIIRSAEVLGVHAIIFSLNQNVPITDTVVKASSGAIFHIDICKVNNLSQTVRTLQKAGVWIYASSLKAEKSLWEIDFQRPHATIIGSEGKGIQLLLVKKSDEIFKIPQIGKTESLNASVAVGVILFEVFRQRKFQQSEHISSTR
jgi:23S rRNA (guanosine2251-2'-O)-methyltransferase